MYADICLPFSAAACRICRFSSVVRYTATSCSRVSSMYTVGVLTLLYVPPEYPWSPRQLEEINKKPLHSHSMGSPKVRIDEDLKKRLVQEVEDNPEYSSQKAFVNKAVRRLLENESEELSEKQKRAIEEYVEKLNN